MPEELSVNGVEYDILCLLGKGKGGYSYLAERGGERFTLKQIHHEPCDYYTFGNKIEAEQNDYRRLTETGIRIPKLLEIDLANERVLKEFVDGPTIAELVQADRVKEDYLRQVREMAAQAAAKGLNIDWFPTNFIVQNELLYYIDYECNPYSEEWNIENWGSKYWSKTPEFLEYMSKNPEKTK